MMNHDNNTMNHDNNTMNHDNNTMNHNNTNNHHTPQTTTLLVSFASSLLPPAGMDTEVEIHIIQLLITLLRHDATAKPLWRLLEKNPALGEVLASGLKRSKSLVSPYLRLLSFLPLRKLDLNVRKMLAEAIAPFTSLQTSSPSIVSQSLKLLISLCDETTRSSALNAFVPGFPVAVKLVEENWQQLFWTSLLRSMVSLLRKTDVQSILSDVSKTLIDDTVQTSLSTAIERRNTRLLSCLLPLLPVCDFLTVDRATLPARLAPLIPLWCEECEKPLQRRCLVALLHLLMKNPQAENVIPDVAATLQRVYKNDVKPLVSLLPDYLASLRPFPADLLPSLLPLLQPRFATLLEPLLRCILQWTPVEGLDSLAPLAGHLSPASRRLVYTLLEKQQALATVDGPLLLRDTAGGDLPLALAATTLLRRLLEERLEPTLATLMAMEPELSVLMGKSPHF